MKGKEKACKTCTNEKCESKPRKNKEFSVRLDECQVIKVEAMSEEEAIDKVWSNFQKLFTKDVLMVWEE